MMLSLIAAGLLTVQSEMPQSADQEIVVIAQRLRRIKLRLDRRKGVLRSCRVRVSSGDATLDEYACRAVAECMAAGASRRRELESCLDEKTVLFARARRAGAIPPPPRLPSAN